MAPGSARAGRLRSAARGAALAAALLGAACVTTYEEAPLFETDLRRPDFAVTQTIPFGETPASPEEQLLLELYAGVFTRLEEAVAEGNADTIDSLLGAYDRGALPDWVVARFDGYRALADGIRFVRHATERSTLEVAAPAPALGEERPLEFLFTLPPAAEPAELGARDDDDPCGFLVALTVEDAFVDGTSRRYSSQDFLWPPTRHRLAGTAALTLPVRVDIPAAGAVARTVHLRVDLLPGYVTLGGERAAVKLTTLAAVSHTQWPAERADVLADPLAALAAGLREGGLAGARKVWLAAQSARGEAQTAAWALLVEQVRTARPDAAQLAMAALKASTGAGILVGDRDGWLAWWQSRQ
ncbi:MAG: hypothetical protein RL398_3315 [Planctomycetota bacterium]